MLQEILFYVFASLSILSGLCVITAKHPVRCVLFLVLTFVATSVTWLLMQVEFLALALIVVYVGAVLVLFLFVVMMIDVDETVEQKSSKKMWPIVALFGAAMIAMLAWLLGPKHFGLAVVPALAPLPVDYSSVRVLGDALYSNYLYAFEIAAMLLLAAMIAAISLTFRGRRQGTKSQDIAKQIKTKSHDRIKIVQVESKESSYKAKENS
jgi:NADH-quinone oxidoreductase subunit J